MDARTGNCVCSRSRLQGGIGLKDRSQRSEVRGQKSEVRSQKSESEVRSQRSEVGGQRSEVGGQRSSRKSRSGSELYFHAILTLPPPPCVGGGTIRRLCGVSAPSTHPGWVA